ncbi:MAG: toll/interleukin-1 receptor domain-containing protein [Planctomycetaceae bacterium]|nr:toll/interleukin-1 receptor domain-containing protein [Planctomycetaceae bacterium]
MINSDSTSGAWIFVSHSHRDLEKVRAIRNELEKRGHNPILFYLKCLETDDARLPDLIRDEIKAREWFILCDSPQAKESRWVQQEIELIQGMEGKVFETVDLSQNLETELHKIIRLSRRATVFLSYARSDEVSAERIRQSLLNHDFAVWDESAMAAGDDFTVQLRQGIDEAAARGFVLVLLSPASMTSTWRKYETDYAFSIKANIIPVVVAPFDPAALPPQLAQLQWFDLTTGDFDRGVERLVESLKTRAMNLVAEKVAVSSACRSAASTSAFSNFALRNVSTISASGVEIRRTREATPCGRFLGRLPTRSSTCRSVSTAVSFSATIREANASCSAAGSRDRL